MNLFILQLISLMLIPTSEARRSYYLVEIDNSDYEKVLKKSDLALAFFYREPCKECETSLPEVSKAADSLASNPLITVATVNCSGVSQETCKQRDVKYEFPYVVRHGKLYQQMYRNFNATELTEYMGKQLGPSWRKLKTFQQIEDYLKNGTTAVVAGFFPKLSKRRRDFQDLAHYLRDDYRFVLIESLKKEEILLFHPFHMRNKLENHTTVYEGVVNLETIQPWLWKSYDGVVKLRTKDIWSDFSYPLIVVYLDLDVDKNFQWFKYVHTRAVKAALPFKGFLNIGMSSRKDFEEEIEGLPPNAILVVGLERSGHRYLMEEDFSFETLQKFIYAFLRHELTPYGASQPLPKHNDGLIKEVVKLNFKDLVLDNGKDTLILFHMSTCGACAKFLPVFETLADELKLENLVIAKTDIGKNALPAAYFVENVPAVGLALKHAKDKKPLFHQGAMTVDDLIQFVAKHTTTQLKKYNRKGSVRRIRNEL